MPTFRSTNPMEHIEVDEYILEKVQSVQENRAKKYSKLQSDFKHRKNIKRNERKIERQNRKRDRK